MDLDGRKRRILKALINDYITTAEPVGSRTIAKKYNLGISSATIRNEMADLEDMGYLEQPHTSAGRIPSDKGYRAYVDHLMNMESLTKQEIELIKESICKVAMCEIDKIIRDTSRVLSMLTNYTALVLPPQTKISTVKHIQLVSIDNQTIMAIVVTSFGIVKNAVITLSKPITLDKLTMLNNLLNDKLIGLTIQDINLEIISDVQKDMTGYMEIWNEIVPILSESLKCSDDREVYLEGSSNILNFPEYSAIDKAKALLKVLDKKDFLYKLLAYDKEEVKISIGHENEYDEIKDCSLITTTYKIGDKIVGSIGIIGPTRMYYSKVLPVLKYFRAYLNEALKNYDGDK